MLVGGGPVPGAVGGRHRMQDAHAYTSRTPQRHAFAGCGPPTTGDTPGSGPKGPRPHEHLRLQPSFNTHPHSASAVPALSSAPQPSWSRPWSSTAGTSSSWRWTARRWVRAAGEGGGVGGTSVQLINTDGSSQTCFPGGTALARCASALAGPCWFTAIASVHPVPSPHASPPPRAPRPLWPPPAPRCRSRGPSS